MNRLTYILLFIALLIFYQTGVFAKEDINFNQPSSKPEDIFLAAKSFLMNESIQISKYSLRNMQFNYVSRGWWLYFVKDDGSLGTDFSLTIDDIDNTNIHIEG